MAVGSKRGQAAVVRGTGKNNSGGGHARIPGDKNGLGALVESRDQQGEAGKECQRWNQSS